jgi:Tol biopolymer transport system component
MGVVPRLRRCLPQQAGIRIRRLAGWGGFPLIKGKMRLFVLTGMVALALHAEGQVSSPVSSVPVWQVKDVRDVTPEGALASAPQWSPDGMWISFAGPKGNGIGLVRPDGSDWRWLTREPLSGYKHAWSPDASRMVFRTRKVDAAGRSYAVRVLTLKGEVESATDWMRDAQPPLWQRGTEGMRWIGQTGTEESAGPWIPCSLPAPPPLPVPPLLYYRSQQLQRRSATGLEPLSGGMSFDPQWTRDGSRVAFDAEDHIAVSDGLSAAGTVQLGPGQRPAWSPDGKWIVYQKTQDHTHAAGDQSVHTGDTLTHQHAGGTNHRIVESELWITAADGSVRFQLTHTPDVLEVEPQWSPDSSMIVCGTEGDGKLLVLRLTEAGPLRYQKSKNPEETKSK